MSNTTLVEELLQSSSITPPSVSIKENRNAQEMSLFNQLDEKSQQQVNIIVKQIDEKDLLSITNYGVNLQKTMGDFSHQMISHIKMNDTGDVGDILNELMYTLNDTNTHQNFIGKLFGYAKRTIYDLQSKYQELGPRVDKIADRLEQEKSKLLNDNVSLEGLYNQNKVFFEALNVYVAAGELKINELEATIIPNALYEANMSNDQMCVQKVKDLEQFLERLEKRNHDLKLTRQMTIQQASQIRLIQNTNQVLAEKIQSSITTAIPLWKNQIAISMTLSHQKEAVDAQKLVSDTTNRLMLKNSEMLKISTIETARENERGIIDLETLQKTQKDLIETLEETLKIQQEGRARRRKAEVELTNMEEDLRQKLLVLSHKEN